MVKGRGWLGSRVSGEREKNPTDMEIKGTNVNWFVSIFRERRKKQRRNSPRSSR